MSQRKEISCEVMTGTFTVLLVIINASKQWSYQTTGLRENHGILELYM